MDEKIYTRAFKIIQGHVMGVKGLERIYKGLQGYKRVNTVYTKRMQIVPEKFQEQFQQNSRKMQAGPAASQAGAPKTDEAEEELKRKSTEVIIDICISSVFFQFS